MPSYSDMPTKAQIDAIDHVPSLELLRDDIDRSIARIETDLEFGDGDDEWYDRARNALAFHKYTGRLINRQIKKLSPKTTPFAALAKVPNATRERKECIPLTLELLDGQIVDPDTLSTLEELESAKAHLTRQMMAAEADREDEIVNYDAGSRDENWLLRVAGARKRAGAAHQAIITRLAAIRRDHKAAQQRARDLDRHAAFVEAARAVLPRQVFLDLWTRVDREAAEREMSGGSEDQSPETTPEHQERAG